jgi:hypothetical protein
VDYYLAIRYSQKSTRISNGSILKIPFKTKNGDRLAFGIGSKGRYFSIYMVNKCYALVFFSFTILRTFTYRRYHDLMTSAARRPFDRRLFSSFRWRRNFFVMGVYPHNHTLCLHVSLRNVNHYKLLVEVRSDCIRIIQKTVLLAGGIILLHSNVFRFFM